MKALSKMFGAIRYISDNARGFFTAYYNKPEEKRKKIMESFNAFAEELYR